MSRHAEHRVDDLLDEVDATDEQRKALAGVEKPVLEEAFRFFDGHPAAKKELWAEWSSDRADAERVHARVDERIDGLRKVAHAVADAVLKAHAVLTPAQRAQVTEEWGPRE
jgi:Spy/CpxP family protein refolding chaperone